MTAQDGGPRIRVAVVDDQPLLVSVFAALITNEDDMEVVATATDGAEAVTVAAEHDVDVMLMDIRMPHLDGIEATRQILERADRPRILVLTTFNVDELVLAACSAGARGFLLKDAEPTAVLEAIRAVHHGEAVIAGQAAPALLAALRDTSTRPTTTLADTSAPEPSDLIAGLTAREVEVLRLIAVGRTNAEIAEELFIAQTTVKTHVGNLLLKLTARDRVALVVLAHGAGLVGTPGTIPLPTG